MEESVFTKIINGEIPSHKVYEDDQTFAFLDIHPVAPGHVLIVPKKPAPFLWDLDLETYQAVMATTQKLAKHIRAVLDVPFVGVQVVGVDVRHAHVHLIPFATVEEFRNHPDPTSEPDHEALAVLATKLKL